MVFFPTPIFLGKKKKKAKQNKNPPARRGLVTKAKPFGDKGTSKKKKGEGEESAPYLYWGRAHPSIRNIKPTAPPKDRLIRAATEHTPASGEGLVTMEQHKPSGAVGGRRCLSVGGVRKAAAAPLSPSPPPAAPAPLSPLPRQRRSPTAPGQLRSAPAPLPTRSPPAEALGPPPPPPGAARPTQKR